MYRKIDMLNELNSLSSDEVAYWKRMFKSNLKIGVEIECEYERRESGSSIISALKSALEPTNSVSTFGKYGIYCVKSDGSLRNGAELCTVGRRVSFLDLYEQYKFICAKIIEHSPVMNSRAGLHNHVLLDYGSSHSSVEKPVPGIIFKNFAQLMRRHAPELVWLTSSVYEEGEDTITRYKDFCKHDSLFNNVVAGRTVESYQSNLMSDNRYQFMNLNTMDVIGDDINKFHFELRFPDCSVIPAQIAAQNVLYAAMLMKAIELSEHGLMGTGSDWSETKSLIDYIRTREDGDERCSDPISDTQKNLCRERAKDMIQMLKPQIAHFDSKAYMVLVSLADSPLSMMLRTTNVQGINDYFDTMISSMYDSKLDQSEDLIRLINMMEIQGCTNIANWQYKAAEKLGKPIAEVQSKMFNLNMFKPFDYDLELGLVYFR